jgi:hypothetical protein
MGFDWKHLLGKAAPGILAVLTSGGSMGAGAAIKILGSVLLKKETASEDEVAAALATNNPALAVQLMEAEFAFKQEIAKNGLRLEEIDAGDRASARARQIALPKDWTPNVLTMGILVIYAVVQFTIITHNVPKENHDVVLRSFATLENVVLAIVFYWFGSSHGNRKKDDALIEWAGQS